MLDHPHSVCLDSSIGVREAFSAALGGWRKQKRIPLKQVAADLGVSISTINAWERGERFPTGYHIELIVKYTSLAPCRLFCVCTEQGPPTIPDGPAPNSHGFV